MKNQKTSLYDKALLIFTSIFILALGALIFILPQNSFSESENRYLNTLPSVSAEKILNGEYAKELSSFYSDQIPMRSFFTTVYSVFETSLGKKEINGVIRFNDHLIARDGKAQSISANAIPPSAKSLIVKSKHEIFKNDSKSLSLYYKTDHHKNARGAYLLYRNACELLNTTPFDEDFFKKETVCKDFYGTSYFRSCLPRWLISPDEITLYRYDGDNAVRMLADGKELDFFGFYDMSRLSSADKYAIFLGGNYARLTIKVDESKPTLLIIKDSFANAVAPLLALHFNIEMLDPRYLSPSELQKQINSIPFDKAIIIGSSAWVGCYLTQ